MNLSELLIIFVNKVLITQTDHVVQVVYSVKIEVFMLVLFCIWPRDAEWNQRQLWLAAAPPAKDQWYNVLIDI